MPKQGALRWKLGIDDDDDCRHVFTFGKMKHVAYSDNALVKMREYLEQNGIDEVWREYRAR